MKERVVDVVLEDFESRNIQRNSTCLAAVIPLRSHFSGAIRSIHLYQSFHLQGLMILEYSQ